MQQEPGLLAALLQIRDGYTLKLCPDGADKLEEHWRVPAYVPALRNLVRSYGYGHIAIVMLR